MSITAPELPPKEPTAPAAGDDLGFDLPKAAPLGARRGALAALGLVGLVAVGLAAGLVPRLRARRALEERTEELRGQTLRVQIVAPKVKASDRALTLTGSVEPLEETFVHPRASGYVRTWAVDLGDKVEAGALLAEIDTPELDQQLEQARAQQAEATAKLAEARASQGLSAATLERYQALAPKGVTSEEELDQKRAGALVGTAAVQVAEAAVNAQQANVRRLSQLKSFSRVTAPFAGTITERKAVRGALVSPSTPLFKLSAVDTVRVLLQVPQDIAPSVRAGTPAPVHVREYPGRTFEAKVTRAAGALDSASRTMATEVRVANADGALLTGMFATVALTLPTPHKVFEIPPSALLTDAEGQRVGVVDASGQLRLVPVVVERDTGPVLEIASGLTGDERVVRLASPELVDGRPVEVVAPGS